MARRTAVGCLLPVLMALLFFFLGLVAPSQQLESVATGIRMERALATSDSDLICPTEGASCVADPTCERCYNEGLAKREACLLEVGGTLSCSDAQEYYCCTLSNEDEDCENDMLLSDFIECFHETSNPECASVGQYIDLSACSDSQVLPGEDDSEGGVAGLIVSLVILLGFVGCVCCCCRCCYRRCKRKDARSPPQRPAAPQEPPKYIRPQVKEEARPSPKTYTIRHAKAEPPPPTTEYERRHQQVVEKKELADKAYRSGSYQRAINLYSEAIGLVDQWDTATKANLLAHRVAALTNLGRNEDAVRDCDQALYLKPDYPKVLLRKGRLHSRLGQWDLAIQALETCRNSTTALPETVREATSELEQCRQSRLEALEGEIGRRREAEEKKKEDADATDHARVVASDLRSQDHYATLGVARSAGASEIRKAYFKLAKVHHPDKNDGDVVSVERFKGIQRAYDVLRKPAERRAYDASL